jgi:hypothetical protein
VFGAVSYLCSSWWDLQLLLISQAKRDASSCFGCLVMVEDAALECCVSELLPGQTWWLPCSGISLLECCYQVWKARNEMWWISQIVGHTFAKFALAVAAASGLAVSGLV